MIEVSSSGMALIIVISAVLLTGAMAFGMRLIIMHESRIGEVLGLAVVALSAVLMCCCGVDGLVGVASGGEVVGEPSFEMTSTARIRSFSESESESTSFSGRMVGVLVYKTIDGAASTSSHSKYTVMEDVYGDGGYSRAEYPAERVRIYEDVDEPGESPRVEKFEKRVVQRTEWLAFYNEEEFLAGEEVRIHVAPGTVFDLGE